MPTLRQLYWDTYQSWVDILPERHTSVMLFNGHFRGVPKSVCNFPGAGQLPGDQKGKVVGVGVQVHASDQHIEDVLRSAASFELHISDKAMFHTHLSLAEEHLSDEERSGEEVVEPGGVIKMGSPLFIPPRQGFYGLLGFDGAAAVLMRKIGTRVGPGAGWASVITYLLMDVERVEQ